MHQKFPWNSHQRTAHLLKNNHKHKIFRWVFVYYDLVRPEDFVHLHCHSTYSLLEALPSPEEIVLRAKELGQSAVALTDRGYTYGLIEFYQEANKCGIRPILGLEVFVAPESRFDTSNGSSAGSPLVLLASSQEGYQNLLHLSTLAATEGMAQRPRVDLELLLKYGKGLIALSGPLEGAIPQAALAEDGKRLMELAERYSACFGKGNLYFELIDLPHLTGQAEANQQLIQWGTKLKIPVVATCNSHYCRTEDAEAHDVLLCIQKNAHIADPSRFSMREHDCSMRSFAELTKAFSHVPEALANTRVISDRCSVAFSFQEHHIPHFPVPGNENASVYLRRLCEEGLHKRYPSPTQVHKERLNYELQIIEQMGFSSYFLIVADFINEAKGRGITVGPGRGSAAGSIVSYCLNITTLDPLEHGLIFERFLNPERISMPDIDTDFADTRRDEILEYVRGKYGRDRVVQICTFGTLAARAAVKDVGRAYGIPFMEMNTFAKLIPDRTGTTLGEALATTELKAAYESNETYQKIIDAALKLEGKARHVSVHACGVIITPKPAVSYTALQRAPKDESVIITQYSAKPLEALGLLKMDFLGLTNLTVIQTALAIIERTRGVSIDISNVPIDDENTFALLQRGDTTGVFQFESAGMRRYLRQLKPTAFNDITAMAALYRPGPMEWIPSYIKRKHKKENVSYLHPSLEKIFKETYGIGVYQEQILQLARVFAGYSLGEADLLRRAIGKKIKEELDAQREKFITGAVAKGYKKELATTIFEEVIMPFAGYGFPKAHAAGYARIAYETAYLKANYPAEFMAALLSSDADDTDRVLIEIEECRSMGIAVLPPDINESRNQFTVVPPQSGSSKSKKGDARGWSIRFGLTAIKGIGDSSVEHIIRERTTSGMFSSLQNFARRMPTKILNKKFLESLAKAGALDCFADRANIMEHYENIVSYRKAQGDVGASQVNLFGAAAEAVETPLVLPQTSPASPQQKLQWEKEALGLYVSSHPLAGLRKYIAKKARLIGELSRKEMNGKVTIVGLPELTKKITTKKGEAMAIVTVEDPTGKMEVTFFPRLWADAAALLQQEDSVLVIGGTLDERSGQLQLRAEAVKRSSLSTMITRAKDDGSYDEEEARRGIVPMVKQETQADEAVDLIDEEGNVIAGEKIVIREQGNATDIFGPLGQWIAQGMRMENILGELGFSEVPSNASPPSPSISLHTLVLPERAPKQLLLDLKHILQTFPGRERVQLKIGNQLLELPITIRMSTIVEQKIAEVLARYTERTQGGT